MTKKRFSCSLRVRYSEIDGQRRVFNPHFMTYIEVALNEYSREVFGPYHQLMLDPNHDFEIVLVKSEMEFFKPAMMDDLLHISCGLVKLGRSSFTMEYDIKKDGEEDLIVRATKVYVSIDLKTNKSSPLPPEIRRRMIEYEGWTET